jgi:hypothetical protein
MLTAFLFSNQKEMLKNVDENHPERAALLQAREEVEAVVSELNEQKRQAEEMEKLMQALSKIKSDEASSLTFFFSFVRNS